MTTLFNDKALEVAQALRGKQTEVIRLLGEARGPLSRGKMYDRLEMSAGLNHVLGYNDPDKRALHDEKKYPSLITLGLITLDILDIDGLEERVYFLTKLGREVHSYLSSLPTPIE